MRTLNLLAAAIVSVWLLSGTASHALVLLNDNFDTENGGIPQLNYFGLANFNVANAGTGGAVDLIGNGSFDFYPGNGLYVDICGSSSACGVLTTKQTFGAGDYTITLGIAGNARVNATDAVNVSFGPLSASFPLTRSQIATEVENVTLSAPSALTISDQGLLGPLIGDILLSVRIETAGGAAVPEPASLALLSASLICFAAIRRRRITPSAEPLN